MRSIYLSPEAQTFLRGDGTFWNPYDASTRDKFDVLMSGFEENIRINLLPGTFYTRGCQEEGTYRARDWMVKSGWYIKGAGQGKTTVKLDFRAGDSITNNYIYSVFGTRIDATARIGDSTISDLTIDLNAQNTIVNGSKTIALSAVSLKGTRNEVRNVEVINYGALSAQKESKTVCLASCWETSKPAQSVIYGDRQIIDGVTIHKFVPSIPTAGMLTTIYNGGGGVGNGQLGWSAKPVIRNCFVSSDYYNQAGYEDQANIRGISVGSCEDAVIEYNTTSGLLTSIYIGTGCYKTDSVVIRDNRFFGGRKVINFDLGTGYTTHLGGSDYVRVGRGVIENNQIILRLPSDSIKSYGIQVTGTSIVAGKFVTKQLIIRGNIFTWASPDIYSIGAQSYCAMLFWDGTSGICAENNYINLPIDNVLNNERLALIELRGDENRCFFKYNTSRVYRQPTATYLIQGTGNYAPWMSV